MQGLLTFPAMLIVLDKVGWIPSGLDIGPLEAFSGTGWLETTRDHFAAIQVTMGDTYEFLASADENTIGDYTLALTTYP